MLKEEPLKIVGAACLLLYSNFVDGYGLLAQAVQSGGASPEKLKELCKCGRCSVTSDLREKETSTIPILNGSPTETTNSRSTFRAISERSRGGRLVGVMWVWESSRRVRETASEGCALEMVWKGIVNETC